jgi:hypothetical protein
VTNADLTGDVTTSGGVATTLATVATPGTSTKITFNAKGLVTSGVQAAASDLSNGVTGSGVIVLATSPALTTPTGIVKGDVGLGSVDNTSDATKNSATVTLTNKRITQRVVSLTNATSFTLSADTADMNTQVNTQAVGTFTANAPSGTPTDGQKLIFRIKSTNVQTYSWNGAFRGSTSNPLPASSTGASKTDYIGFIYNNADTKWDCVAVDGGH